MNSLPVRIWFSLVLLISTSLSAATNWPEFRGPTGQGHAEAKNLPVEWSQTKNVAWKQVIPGKGWSSPVLAEDHLYLTTAVDEGGKLSLRTLCLEAKTGQSVWNVEVFRYDQATGIHGKNSHASATPILEGDKLYVHFGHQGTACLNRDGTIVWRNDQIKYAPVHGNGGSPILTPDALIFSCDGAENPFIIALHKSNGEILWKQPRHNTAQKYFSFSTPLLISVNDQPQIISPASNLVAAYNPATGKELWRVTYTGYSVVPRPVFGHGLVFISTSFDRPSVLAIRPDGQGDVTETHVAWTTSRGAPNTPSLLLVGDELYMVSDGGIATALDAKTGKVHWQERLGGNFSASPVFADGKIYLQNEEGVGVVLQPGREFSRLATNPLEERTLASYAVGDGTLYIRAEHHLYRISR